MNYLIKTPRSQAGVFLISKDLFTGRRLRDMSPVTV